jgi:uncharacterized membrane protein
MKPHLFLHSLIRTRPHLSLATVLGVVVALFLPDTMRPMTRALVAWNAAVWPYLITMAWMMMRADAAKVKAVSGKQDENAGMLLAAMSVAAIISITAIIIELGGVGQLPADERSTRYAFTALTVFGSWFLLGTVFSFHYAHVFYHADPTALPLQFPDNEDQPDYWDFLYFAFTIAVAVQTSDVAVMSKSMRKLVLGQSVLTFFFNLVILGLSINIAAGLINQ